VRQVLGNHPWTRSVRTSSRTFLYNAKENERLQETFQDAVPNQMDVANQTASQSIVASEFNKNPFHPIHYPSGHKRGAKGVGIVLVLGIYKARGKKKIKMSMMQE
jgi:hypothetical protein